MCGRFTLSMDIEALQEAFPGVDFGVYLTPSFNIAPSQPVLAISNQNPSKAQLLHWGLIPSWSKDRKIAYKLINARGETLAEKPSFKRPFRQQRCLIIADGFYEWKKEAGAKVPVYIHLKEKTPFAFAGLWDQWRSTEGDLIQSCTIITTEANELLSPVHHRMPVILPPTDYSFWLDKTIEHPEELQRVIRSFESDQMTYYPVSTFVNSPTNNTPKCIESLSA